jgi:hypothetical protein
VPWPGLGPMAQAASCRACRWSAWAREIITFVVPAHAVSESLPEILFSGTPALCRRGTGAA